MPFCRTLKRWNRRNFYFLQFWYRLHRVYEICRWEKEVVDKMKCYSHRMVKVKRLVLRSLIFIRDASRIQLRCDSQIWQKYNNFVCNRKKIEKHSVLLRFYHKKMNFIKYGMSHAPPSLTLFVHFLIDQ